MVQNPEELLNRADRANSSKSFLSSFLAFRNNDDVGDLYQQAANIFVAKKEHTKAADTFSKEAEWHQKEENLSEAAFAWGKAYSNYKAACNLNLAISALEHAIEAYRFSGQLRRCGDAEEKLAELYQQLGDLGQTCQHLEAAGECYKLDGAANAANKCLTQAAHHYAEIEQYPRAIEIYEQVASANLESNLTKYSAKEHWLRASLCRLAAKDTIAATHGLQAYVAQDNTFESTREHKFVKALIGIVREDQGLEAFVQCLGEYNKITQLDNWKTRILLKIKNGLAVDEEAMIL